MSEHPWRAHDLSTVSGDGDGDGVRWTLEDPDDLNANLVHLGPGSGIGEHVNDQVDVLVVVLGGSGTATVDEDGPVGLAAQTVALLPKGSRRRIDAGPDGMRYLTVHRRRGPLGIRGRS